MDELLESSLPDYARDSARVWQLSVVAVMFWMIIFPVWFSKSPQSSSNSNPKVESKDKKNESSSSPSPERRTKKFLALIGILIGFIFCILTVLDVIINFSPYNYFMPRRVFVAPLLTPDECRSMLYMARGAALANYHELRDSDSTTIQAAAAAASVNSSSDEHDFLKYPYGWHKRPGPTANLHLERDPFTAQNRTWLTDLLNRRLAPSISRFYGIPESSIEANDMYIVLYDADVPASLQNHTDAGDVTFQILLLDDYDGGGTLFWNRAKNEPFAQVEPALGSLTAYSANINHEEVPVTDGTRVLLTGNLQFNPPPTNFLASWFNLAWTLARCKYDYYLGPPGFPEKLYPALHEFSYILQTIGDWFAPHVVETIVPSSKVPAYIEALDKLYESTAKENHPRAVWWKSQQLQAPKAKLAPDVGKSDEL